MKKIIFFVICIICILTSSCIESSDDNVDLLDDNSCPYLLTVQYTFEKWLSETEAYEYIKDAENIGEVLISIDSMHIPTDNHSSNFLQEGAKLYVVDEGIIAIEDGENFYAALLVVNIE